MEYLSTIALTVIFTVLLLVIYKVVINPQIVIIPNTNNMARCPDGWAYDSAGSICRPNIETQCMPFDPDADAIQTPAAKCNLARTCGTTWSGMCI